MTAAFVLTFLRTRWTWIVIALLLAALGAQQIRVSHAQTEAAEARAELASDRVTYAQAAAEAQRAARFEESRRQTERQEVIRHAQEQTAAAEATARDAGRAAAGLRQQLAALIAASRRAATNPGAATGSPPTADPLDLLADVLQRADDRSGDLAAEADRRGIAGAACVAAYESLITSTAPK